MIKNDESDRIWIWWFEQRTEWCDQFTITNSLEKGHVWHLYCLLIVNFSFLTMTYGFLRELSSAKQIYNTRARYYSQYCNRAVNKTETFRHFSACSLLEKVRNKLRCQEKCQKVVTATKTDSVESLGGQESRSEKWHLKVRFE